MTHVEASVCCYIYSCAHQSILSDAVFVKRLSRAELLRSVGL